MKVSQLVPEVGSLQTFDDGSKSLRTLGVIILSRSEAEIQVIGGGWTSKMVQVARIIYQAGGHKKHSNAKDPPETLALTGNLYQNKDRRERINLSAPIPIPVSSFFVGLGIRWKIARFNVAMM